MNILYINLRQLSTRFDRMILTLLATYQSHITWTVAIITWYPSQVIKTDYIVNKKITRDYKWGNYDLINSALTKVEWELGCLYGGQYQSMLDLF